MMDCATCKRPMRAHEPALKVWGELPFDTMMDVMAHQWRKDATRIIYAHAQHYHDECLVNPSLPQKEQRKFLEEDLKRHRTKYVLHYVHAFDETRRHEGGAGPSKVTKKHEKIIQSKLEEDVLTYQLPDDLDRVFRGEKPLLWRGTMTSNQCKRKTENSIQLLSLPGQGRIQDVVDRKLVTVISIVLRLNGSTLTLVPKTPDTTWCWSLTAEQILSMHRLTELDLF
ncbi:hypothetical protein F5Y08DRAFT_49445 [Xylaria arbuscula]|nr:hypothetical protein F5Y08DRAFT_49445 [Xylaria arbuscula]